MALEPVSGEPGSAALLSLSLPVYTGHQALICGDLGGIVEKANALNTEGAEVARRSLRGMGRVAVVAPSPHVSKARHGAPGDVKRLQNIEPPEFRLRVGDYRLRFHDYGHTLYVTAVRHRREVYR
jgi:hypothetical protein